MAAASKHDYSIVENNEEAPERGALKSYKNLASSVILTAMHDLEKAFAIQRKNKAKKGHLLPLALIEPYAWFTSKSEGAFSFRWCCLVIDKCPERVFSKIFTLAGGSHAGEDD